FIAGTIRAAREFQFFMQARGLVTIHQKLAFPRCEAAAMFPDAERILPAWRVRWNREFAKADPANGLAVRPFEQSPSRRRILDLGRAVEPVDHLLGRIGNRVRQLQVFLDRSEAEAVQRQGTERDYFAGLIERFVREDVRDETGPFERELFRDRNRLFAAAAFG